MIFQMVAALGAIGLIFGISVAVMWLFAPRPEDIPQQYDR